ncbi:uncharacterized protein LOC108673434 [Hyalella azteca]|uniref:Uncharacterized protein LOC108673434 n=1 Tax=Hyalella azteca TaxID=294128 RepID=A0A8B7NSR4_HYAAZ|nr:uncharacterized protein LOC108673434 [Hyalella azteca]
MTFFISISIFFCLQISFRSCIPIAAGLLPAYNLRLSEATVQVAEDFNAPIEKSQGSRKLLTLASDRESRNLLTDLNSSERLVPLTKEQEKPIGYLMKRIIRRPNRIENSTQDYRETARTEYFTTLLFKGRCSVLRRMHPEHLRRHLKKILWELHHNLSREARIVSISCLYRLKIVISLPIYRGERILYNELMLFRGRNFTIDGTEIEFRVILPDDNNVIVEKADPAKNGFHELLILFLITLVCCIFVIMSMVIARCYACIRLMIFKPSLLDLSRYSQDEIPKCMADNFAKTGKVMQVANVYAVPGFLHTIHEKNMTAQQQDQVHDNSEDEISSDWSTEVEFPNYRESISADPFNKRDGEPTKDLQGSNETDKLLNLACMEDKSEKSSAGLVPMYRCRTLNSDYEAVAVDGEDDSDDSMFESVCVTRVTDGYDGRLKIETDM